MSTQRSLAQLKAECRKLNLEVDQSGKREAKKDYIRALQKHYIELMPEEKKTWGFWYRMSIESPQLCFLYSNLREDEISRLYESREVAFEEKLNGIRMIVTYTPEDGFEAYGRNLSVENYLPVCYTDKIYWGDIDCRGLFRKWVGDCEVVSDNPRISTVMEKRGVVTETILQAVAALLSLNSEDTLRIQKELDQPLRLHFFHNLYSIDHDYRKDSYIAQRKELTVQISSFQQVGLPFHKVKAVITNKRAYLECIFENGGEGVIAKPIYNVYIDRESRPRNEWVKIKRTVSGAIGDTVDGFIIGFEPGNPDRGYRDLIGALHVGIYLRKEDGSDEVHMVARVPNIPLVQRERITVFKDGKMGLDPSLYGKVVEVEGQAVSARALRLTHPRLIRWRDDKSKHDCVLDEEVLRSLIV